MGVAYFNCVLVEGRTVLVSYDTASLRPPNPSQRPNTRWERKNVGVVGFFGAVPLSVLRASSSPANQHQRAQQKDELATAQRAAAYFFLGAFGSLLALAFIPSPSPSEFR